MNTREIHSSEEFGALLREHRERNRVGLRKEAQRLGVGTRFLSELERGKPTSQLEKSLKVLLEGYELLAIPRANATNLAQMLGTDFPYDWSNSRMSEEVFIRKVLMRGRYQDVLKIVGYFGFDRVCNELVGVQDGTLKERLGGILSRILMGKLQAGTQESENAAT